MKIFLPSSGIGLVILTAARMLDIGMIYNPLISHGTRRKLQRETAKPDGGSCCSFLCAIKNRPCNSAGGILLFFFIAASLIPNTPRETSREPNN